MDDHRHSFSQLSVIFTVGTKDGPWIDYSDLRIPKFGSGTEAVVSLTFLTIKIYGSVPRMYALFFHRLSILERATDHKCVKECSYSKKKCG